MVKWYAVRSTMQNRCKLCTDKRTLKMVTRTWKINQTFNHKNALLLRFSNTHPILQMGSYQYPSTHTHTHTSKNSEKDKMHNKIITIFSASILTTGQYFTTMTMGYGNTFVLTLQSQRVLRSFYTSKVMRVSAHSEGANKMLSRFSRFYT